MQRLGAASVPVRPAVPWQTLVDSSIGQIEQTVDNSFVRPAPCLQGAGLHFFDECSKIAYSSRVATHVRLHRLTVRTLGSHPGNRGSIPRGVTNKNITARWYFYW